MTSIRKLAAIFLLALAAVLTGCTSAGMTGNVPTIAPTPAGASTGQPEASTVPTKRPGMSTSDALALGTERGLYAGENTPKAAAITVYSVTEFTPTDQYSITEPGIVVDVQISVLPTAPKGGSVTATSSAFSAIDSTNRVYSGSYSSDVTPQLIENGAVKVSAGETVRGYVYIPTTVPIDQLLIRYQVDNGHIYWKAN